MTDNRSKKEKTDALLRSAQDDGTLSAQSARALTLPDIGAQIQAGLGVRVDDVQSSEVVLVTIMPDDSGSIRGSGNAQTVREGHNLVLDALGLSRQRDDILVHTRYLNGEVLFPYVPLPSAVRMTRSNYDPALGTPLYDNTLVLLGTVIAKAQDFLDSGVAVRTVTLLISDGADVHSRSAGSGDVRSVVRDMLRTESHVVAAMGIDDGATDFHRVFTEMGLEDRWILTPANTPAEIRSSFQVFSQSAVKVSQAATLSASALGGFVN